MGVCEKILTYMPCQMLAEFVVKNRKYSIKKAMYNE